LAAKRRKNYPSCRRKIPCAYRGFISVIRPPFFLRLFAANSSGMNALPCTIYISFLGALLALAAGARSAATARVVALLTALTSVGVTLYAAGQFVPGPGLQTLVDVPWISHLGIRYHLAADGISLTLIVLTGPRGGRGHSVLVEHRGTRGRILSRSTSR